jgi:hypothetical protein
VPSAIARDRIHVEHRLRQTFEPVHRVVAGHGEDRPEAARQEVPAQALERVPVPVPGGHVDDDLVAEVAQRLGRCIRAQPRMATRVVGDRQGRDARIAGEVRGHPQRALATRIAELAGPRDELDDGRKRGRSLEHAPEGAWTCPEQRTATMARGAAGTSG